MLLPIIGDIACAILPSLLAVWICYYFRPSAVPIANFALLSLLVSLVLPSLKLQLPQITRLDESRGILVGWQALSMSFSPLILTPPGLLSAIANILFVLAYIMVLCKSEKMFYLSRFNPVIAMSALVVSLFAGEKGFLEFDLRFHPENRLYIGAGTWLCSHVLLAISYSVVGLEQAKLRRLRIPSYGILTLIGLGLLLNLMVWSQEAKKTEWQRVDFVSYAPNGKNLISSILNLKGGIYDLTIDHRIVVWDLETKQVTHVFPLKNKFPTCYAHSPVDDLLAYGIIEEPYGSNPSVKVVLMSTQNGETKSILLGHRNEVLDICFSGDGSHIATASRDRTVRIWKTEDGKEIAKFEENMEVLSVALSPDGRKLAYNPNTTVPAPNGSIVFIPDWQFSPEKKPLMPSAETTAMRVAFSQDSMKLASISRNGVVTLWNLEELSNPISIANQTQQVTSLHFNSKGHRFAYGSSNGDVELWDGDNGKLIKSLNHPVTVRSVAFSPDGTQLVTGEGGTWSFEGAQGIRVWNAESGELELSLNLSLSLAESLKGKIRHPMTFTARLRWMQVTVDASYDGKKKLSRFCVLYACGPSV